MATRLGRARIAAISLRKHFVAVLYPTCDDGLLEERDNAEGVV
jgi:hypothetical protein